VNLTEATFRLTGVTPLLMHNVQMANPLNTWAKQVSELTARKKNITADEFAEGKAKLQFFGGLYWDDEMGLHMPGYNVFRCFTEGGRMSKNGTKLEQGIVAYTPLCAIDPWTAKYDSMEDVYADGHYFTTLVKIGTATVPGTRPQFTEWALDIEFTFDESIVDTSTLLASGVAAGKYKGLGDGRLKGFGRGRFDVEQVS
jgi:hypothetical protein